ncbi:MAG TPA: hypothetical protein VHK70_06690 [Burkholderiaceae bacterium]|jgi:hypothetical protein|nr:hypothetical protein [Burkholderiaceae bacterium]
MKYAARKRIARLLLVCGAYAFIFSATAQPKEFSFGVIGHSFQVSPEESILHQTIAETDDDNLAFVVANGIKTDSEPCSDDLYLRRKALLDTAKNGLVVSLTGSDWTRCRNARNRSSAVERLNRIRDLFFNDEFSLGASRIPLMRQSANAKFRSYAENAHWQIGDIIFATINLPADNNHFRPEAGRNSEFEDRLIANRFWLRRIVGIATHRKLDGIVLFCDADPLTPPSVLQRSQSNTKRDGFTEIRKSIDTLAGRFTGKILLISNDSENRTPTPAVIAWRTKNLGSVAAHSGWMKVTVDKSNPSLFSIAADLRMENPR